MRRCLNNHWIRKHSGDFPFLVEWPYQESWLVASRPTHLYCNGGRREEKRNIGTLQDSKTSPWENSTDLNLIQIWVSSNLTDAPSAEPSISVKKFLSGKQYLLFWCYFTFFLLLLLLFFIFAKKQPSGSNTKR